MTERIVINTGPLVTLTRIGALDVCGRLPYRFVCPEEVRLELDEGERNGHMVVAPPWLETAQVHGGLPPVAVAALDVGEAAVIQLALEQGIDTVCIDEWKGRRAALASGLRVVGVLGLLAQAKKRGLIPAVAPLVRKALAEGIRYDRQLVTAVLQAAGEEL